MKKFLLKSFVLFVLVAASLVAIVILPTRSTSYYQGYPDKLKILANIESPKIILVGGSNVELGLDGYEIEQQMNMSVYNMGDTAILGLRFMVERIKPFIKEGDIVVVSPEYQQFYREILNGQMLVFDYLDQFPEQKQYLNHWGQKFDLYTEWPHYVSRRFQDLIFNVRVPERELDIRQRMYDEYGSNRLYYELVPPKDLTKINLWKRKARLDEYNPEAIEILNELASVAKLKGARAVMIYPTISEKHYLENKDLIDPVVEKLSKAEIEVLGSPQDFLFPLEYFYDTVYHLRDALSVERSKRIIRLLEAVQ